jgi:uncharacterized repeat protein (TIGR01451 family)
MTGSKQTTVLQRRSPSAYRSSRKVFLCCILTVLAVCAGLDNAIAQTAPPTTNTTLVTGLTLPFGQQILTGTAVSAITGKPVRHLWTGDLGGLCRVDPEIDGTGPFTVNTSTCITSVAGVTFLTGRMAYDPLTNDIYAVQNQGGANVARFHFLPDGDSGQGLVSATAEFLGDSGGCGLAGNLPWVVSLGPDANLYVGFKKNGNLVRIISPQNQSVPCSNVQTIGTTKDTKIAKGLGWINHDLWGADIIGIWTIPNADQCFTAANNFTPCHGTILLHTQVQNPFNITTNQAFPSTNGNDLYALNPTGTTVELVSGINTIAPAINTTYAQGIPLGISIIVDASDPANEVVYVSSDPAVDGGVAGQGSVIRITNNATSAPQPPSIPSPVSAANGGDSQAVVSWPADGTGTITSYTVRTNPGNGSVVPDKIVTAPSTSTAITGLTNGVSYNFQVSATNPVGTSAFSAPSNTIVVNPITVPSAPTGLSATAGDSQATLSWNPPASNGNATITSYGITAYVNGTPVTGISVGATTTSTVFSGLTNGTTYTFTVHAVNSQGASPESAPSNPVTPTRTVGPTDMAISMSGPSSINTGGNATYTLTISNLGPNFAPQAVVTDSVPTGATFVSATTSQGVCGISGTQFSCNLGGMIATSAGGSSASVTLVLNVTASITNTASVQGNDQNGVALGDPNPANNSASVSTVVSAPPTTTDLQVTGSPQNGGPTSGPSTTDTITWQIKNALNTAANSVVFTVTQPAGLPFNSVSTSIGSCSGPPVGSGGTITCNASTISGGQTMIVTVNFSVPSAGTFSSKGTVSFNGTDTNPANNSFTVTINAK